MIEIEIHKKQNTFLARQSPESQTNKVYTITHRTIIKGVFTLKIIQAIVNDIEKDL